ISGLCDVRWHARRRSELQPPAAFRRRRGRPHHLSVLGVDRRYLDQQRRPQLQSARRPRPRQLRRDAGLETVRRNRRQCSLARPPGRSYGYQRNSSGGNVRAGTSFEFSRMLTGEVAVGWAARTYEDPRLLPLQGLLTSASLVWTATPLTSAKFFATTSIDETTVPGVSGVLTHTYTVEVDHDFRRWLTAIGKFTWGTQDYQGDARFDRF